MIIAIYGGSNTGKTTIAKLLQGMTGLELRSCGDIVKHTAAQAEIDVGQVPDDMHRSIDHDTWTWVDGKEKGIVEGRFLDQVLSPSDQHVVFVKLMAGDAARADRATIRRGSPISVGDIQSMDDEDGKFRERMYKGQAAQPAIVLDTTDLSKEACASELHILLKERGYVPG